MHTDEKLMVGRKVLAGIFWGALLFCPLNRRYRRAQSCMTLMPMVARFSVTLSRIKGLA